jgi:hypothetical protein
VTDGPVADAAFTDADYPALFLTADAASLWGQGRYLLFARLELLCIFLSAGLGAVISILGVAGSRAVATAAAVLLVAAALIRSLNRSTQPNKKWFEGRAVAESVKTLTWKYMTHVSPLQAEGSKADDVFSRDLAEILGDRTLLIPRRHALSSRMEQITPAMRRIRGLTFDERRTLYIRYRLQDQLAWYTRSSEALKRQGDLWFLGGALFEVLALAAAIFLIASPTGGNFIGLFSTAAAAAVSLSQLRADSEAADRYALAAQELSIIEPRMENADEKTFAECVKEAEAAISREHKMWVAKRG